MANELPAIDVARFKRALTNLRRAQADLEELAQMYPSISTDEGNRIATLAAQQCKRAVDFADESVWLATTEGRDAFAA